MNKLLGLFVGAATITAVSSAAQAQDDMYISVSGGLTFFEIDDLMRDGAQAVSDFYGGTTTVRYDTSALTGRFAVGTEISEKARIEVGYFRTSKLDIDVSNTKAGEGSASISADGFDIVGKYYLDSDFAVKAGLHMSEAEAKGGGLTLSESGSGFVVGAEVSAGENSFVGYDYYMDVAGQANVGYLYLGMKF